MITMYNIKSLLSQSVVPEIVLVVSEKSEAEVFSEAFPQINVVRYPNRPLGGKWQYGVQHAYTLKADPLIILGSDDILGPNFIENCTRIAGKTHDFIGLFQWYMHHDAKAYLCDYMAKIPLGGGRVYSAELLDKIKWTLFDPHKSKHLDDLGYAKTAKETTSRLEVRDAKAEGLVIHSIKGNWHMINPFTTTHKNIKVAEVRSTLEFLPDLPLWGVSRRYANDDLA